MPFLISLQYFLILFCFDHFIFILVLMFFLLPNLFTSCLLSYLGRFAAYQTSSSKNIWT